MVLYYKDIFIQVYIVHQTLTPFLPIPPISLLGITHAKEVLGLPLIFTPRPPFIYLLTYFFIETSFQQVAQAWLCSSNRT